MSRERFARLGRRIVVLAATVAVIGVAVGVVQVAAQWRAEAAPLDTAPVGMIGDQRRLRHRGTSVPRTSRTRWTAWRGRSRASRPR